MAFDIGQLIKNQVKFNETLWDRRAMDSVGMDVDWKGLITDIFTDFPVLDKVEYGVSTGPTTEYKGYSLISRPHQVRHPLNPSKFREGLLSHINEDLKRLNKTNYLYYLSMWIPIYGFSKPAEEENVIKNYRWGMTHYAIKVII